jgi:serine O-acetyltransferase
MVFADLEARMSTRYLHSDIHDLRRPSADVPDWSRERSVTWWEPSRRLLGALRAYARAKQRGGLLGSILAKVAVFRHRFWSAVTGADIPLNCRGIGGGLLLPHPNGVVIHPEAHIGPNCLLFQQVTIGTGSIPGTPRIGGHVDIGAGAKILGGVVIGDHAVIGANAVVVTDVPAYSVAVGVPAVVRRREMELVEEEADAPSSRKRAVY